MTSDNPKLDLVNINAYVKFVLKILRGNEIPTSIKGHNSVTNVRKLMPGNPDLDLANINPYIYKIL